MPLLLLVIWRNLIGNFALIKTPPIDMTQTLTIPQLLELALQHHQAGDLPQAGITPLEGVLSLHKAEQLYRQVLQMQPTNADAWHLLGVLAHQVKNYPVAVELIRKAITLNHTAPTFYNNLGNALREQEQLTAAMECYQRALTLDSQFAEAHNNLGNVFILQGSLIEAVTCFQRALSLNPNYVNAYKNLGIALNELGKFAEAIHCYQRALSLSPNNAEVYHNLGKVFKNLAKFTEAEACYQRALELNPNFPDAYNDLGNTLQEEGKLTEAENNFRRALALDATFGEAYHNLGNLLKDQGMLEEAIASYRQALQIKSLGVIQSSLLFTLNYVSGYDRATLFSEHQRFNELHILPLAHLIKPHLNQRNPGRKLKIGYVSPDFHRHSVAYFIEPLLAQHDHQQFEVFCYSNNIKNDEVTQRLQPLVDHWLTCVGLSDEALAERIRQDQIDILVDLAGHTGNNRLLVFARQPAPVQVTYLGYSNTTGLSTIDYRLTDSYTDPEGVADKFSSEQLVRLPGSYFCYQPPEVSSPLPNQRLPVIQNGYLTFGAFNNYAKLSPSIIAIWAQLLRAVPDSKLLVKARSLNNTATQRACQERFAKLGIPADRLILTGYAPAMTEHLSLYNQVDIALDSFPYNGATTTCETLWMGVPVVTLVGETHVARMGLSILSAVGLTELIAYTEAEYLTICLKLVNNIDDLQNLRASLRERMKASPLMDAPTFTRHLEEAYRQLWERWSG
jgi:predicted O-linked N-acetylglucosamine transferase (SPINDLY family)